MVGLTPEVKQELKAEKGLEVQAQKGVLIIKVANNSPSAKAGIKPGDVIQSIEGKEVNDARAVQDLVEATTVGKQIAVTLDRNGQKITLNMTVESIPDKN